MSIHDPASTGWLANRFDDARAFAENWNIWPARALLRNFAGIVPGSILVSGLLDLAGLSPDDDRTVDLIVAGVSVIALLLLFRWFGNGRGMMFGLLLWVVSFLWWQGLVSAAYMVWQCALWADGKSVDLADVITAAVLSAALLVPGTIGLRRLDPDSDF